MQNYFQDILQIIRHPKTFAEAIAWGKGIKPFSPDFFFSLICFSLYAVLSAAIIFIAPPEFYSAITGAPIHIEHNLWQILLVSSAGSFFTYMASISVFCAFMLFLSKGRLSLRLPVILVLLPAAYSAIFLLRIHVFFHVLSALIAFVLMFVPAFRKNKSFLAMLYCIFLLSVLFIPFQVMLAIAVFFSLPKMFIALQAAEGLISLFYFVNVGKAMSGLSGSKTAAALIAAVLNVAAFSWSLRMAGIISPNIAQILSLS